MRTLPSWVKGFVYSCLCIFTLGQTAFGQGPAAASAYGKLPLSFEPNQGQTAGEVQFLSRGRGYTLFLTPSDSVLALHRGHRGSRADRREPGTTTGVPAALRMHLVGANRSSQGVAEDALPGKSNYLIGNDRTHWRTGVPNYGRVRYRDVYPGIDLVYYGNQRQLEHDFVVVPGADPRRIRLAFDGIQRAEVEKSGDLVLHLADGEVRLQKPVIYQNTPAGRREVAGGFVLRKNQVTIQVGSYDRRRALVIDPVLGYSTYLGGNGEDVATSLAVDGIGNAYLTGYTASTTFPTTAGVLSRTCQNCSGGTDDVFVAKINPTGTALVYSTYISGSNDDEAYAIAIDGIGNAYVTGFTNSSNFPVTAGAFQPALKSFLGNGFVSVLNSTGTSLLYSTFLGGSARDYGNPIALDGGGNIYVGGETYSSDFPTVGTPISTPPPTFYVSNNGGTSFSAPSSDIKSLQLTDVVVDKFTAGALYVGSIGGGVYKSTNSGVTWVQMPTPFNAALNPAQIKGDDVLALVMDPTSTFTGSTARLYAGSEFFGVARTLDGGATWTQINNGSVGSVLSLALNPLNVATLYVGTNGNGVWVSNNANSTSPVTPPSFSQMSLTGLNTVVNALAVDPVAGTVYAGTSGGVFKFSAGTNSWVALTTGITANAFVYALAVDPSGNLYAATSFAGGIFKFNPATQAWTAINGSGGTAMTALAVFGITVDPSAPATLYAGTQKGIFKTTDGGTNWTLLSNGLVTTFASRIAVDPNNSLNLFVGSFNPMSFVAKFPAGGGSPLLLTQFGGVNGQTFITSIAADSLGNSYVGGTLNANLPPPLVGPTSIAGLPAFDAFISKITPGQTVAYSRYLGGSGNDQVVGLAVDSSFNAYVTGVTNSFDFPVTPATAFQPSHNPAPGNDAFVVELDPTGATTLYSSYFGGSGSDYGLNLALLSPGVVAIVGQASSTDLPTVNAIQPFNAGSYDAFFAKFDVTKSGAASLLYSTYVGGSSYDAAAGVGFDSTGNAYVGAYSYSANFPTTAGVIQGASSGAPPDAVVFKLQSTGNSSDLRVTMTAPQNVASGAAYSYTINVTDDGPSPLGAPNVQAFDQLPSNVSLTATPTATIGSCTPVTSTPIAGARVVCTIGTLALNGVSQITIPVTATPASGQSGTTFTNTAIATTSDDDPIPLNNASSVTQTVGIQADLQITNGPSPSTLGVNVAATDQFNIQNNGPSDATGVVVAIPVPAGVTFNGSGNGIPCTPSGAIVICNVGTLTAFSANVILFGWTPTSSGTVNITAIISSADADSNLANNAVTWTTIVGPSADVQLNGSSPATVVAGGNVTYNVTLTNNGPNATDVTFGATMPPTFSFVSANWVNNANTSNGACSFSATANPQISCSVGTLSYSGTPTTANITIVLAAGNQAGLYAATGTVTQSVPNPHPGQLSGSATVAVVLTPNAQEALISTDNAHGTLHLFNPATLSEITPAPPTFIGNPGRSVVVSPNGRLAYVGTRNARYISVYDLSIKAEIDRIPVPGGASSMAMTADGTTLVTGSGDAVALSNTATFAVTTVALNGLIGDSPTASDIGLRNPVIVGSTVYFNPSGNTVTFPVTPIVAIDINSHAISTISLGNGRGTITAGGEDSNLAATPDGRYLIAARTNQLAIIDLANGNAVSSVTDPNVVNTEFALVRGIGDPNVFAYVLTGDITGAADYSVVDLRSGSPSFGQVIGSGGNIILNFGGYQPVLSLDGQTVYAVDLFTNIYRTDRESLHNSQPTATQAFYTGIDQNSFADAIVDLTPVAGAPTVSSVQPSSMIADTATTVTVTGSGFTPGALVRFGQNAPIAAFNVTGAQLQVTVPAGLPVESAMDVVVTNPNSAAPIVQQHLSGVLRGAFTIQAPAAWNPASALVGANIGDSTISVIGQQARQIPLLQNGITEAGALTLASAEVTSDGVYAFTPVTNTFASYITNPNSNSSFGIQTTNLANGIQTFTALDNSGLSLSNAVISANPSTQAPVLYVVDVNPAANHAQLRSLDANPASPTFKLTLPLNIDAGVRISLVNQIAVKSGGRYVYANLNTPASQPPIRRITIFDTLNGSVAGTMDLTPTGLNLSTAPWVYVTPDGNSLLLQTSTSNSIAVFDLSVNPASPTQAAGSPIAAVVPNGSASVTFNSYTVANSRLYATGTALDAAGNVTQRVLEVFQFVPGAPSPFTPIVTYTLPQAASSLVVSSDGSLLYLALQPSNEILVLDVNKVLINDPTAPVTTIRSGYGPARYNLAVNPAPVIIKAFGTPSIPLNGSTSLSFTIQNNNSATTLTGIGFSDTLPAGLVISTPNGQTGACSGGTITATQGTNVVSLTGATLAQSSSCTFSVNVTGIASGNYTNTTGNVTSTNGGTGNTASANLTVASPPTITKAFGAASILLNGSTSLTFTIQNPNTGVTLTGVAFTDNLPAGLVVATPNGLASSCGGTATAVEGAPSLSLAGATLAANTSCMISVNVTGTTSGVKDNSVQVTSAEGGAGNTSNASITVLAVSVTISPTPITMLTGSTQQFTATVTNTTNTDVTWFATLGTISASGLYTAPATGGTAIVAATSVADPTKSALAIVSITSQSQAIAEDWGDNSDGQLGNGTLTGSSTPVQVSGLSGLAAIASGHWHNLALKTDGTVWAWGYNADGELGNGTTTDSSTPVQVSGLSGVMAIAGGNDHTLALKSDGTVWAWGYNVSGQLGNGTTTDSSTPVQVSSLSGVVAIAGGGDHSLALTSAGSVWAWGYNGEGELGNGTVTTTGCACIPSAVQVSNLSGVVAIAGGNDHSLALKSDGTVWAWGYNGLGQLGNGTTTDSSTPVQVSSLSGVVAIAGGENHSLALKSDGTAWAWGWNDSGQLGNGTTTDSSTPVLVSSLSGVAAIAGGVEHSLALKSDGTVWAWGYNFYGQLGNGTSIDSSTPVQVSGISGVVAVAGGREHSLALTANVTPGVTAPVISKAFGAASIPLNGSTSLSFIIQNNNTTITLTGIGFSDTLPAGLVVSTPNGLTGTCGGGTITATQATNVVSLTGATLAQNSSCTFAVNVTGIASGNYTNTTGNVTSTNGGTGNTASANLTVASPPTITKAFGAASILLNGSTSLTFTIQNPNTGVTLTGVAFTDNLPAGLVVATPNGLASSCGGTATAVAGASSLSLAGATLAANTSCMISVNVTGTTPGVMDNSVQVSAAESGAGNTSNASVTVLAAVADVAVTMTASASPVAVLDSVTYQIMLTNNGPSLATGLVLTDTFPASALFASVDDLTDCVLSNSVLTCNFASLGAGSSATVNLILVPLAPSGEGTFANTATVAANEPDSDLSNNSATQNVQVTGADLPGGGAVRNLPGFSNTITTPNDDESFGPVPLGFNINFFGAPVSSLFVNNNGNVTFGSLLGEFTPFPLPTTNVQIIAPYFSDVGTYQTGSGLVTYGNDTVNDRPAFGVNWPNVNYFGEVSPTLLNLFQLILIDRSDLNPGDFDIELNYDKIQWETGDASGGSNGLGGDSARVGYSNGTGITGSYFEFAGSGVPGSFLDSNAASGLIYSTLNSAQPGRYVFQVRNGLVQSSADLAITAAGPQYAAAGSTVTYALSAVNHGPNTATGVTVIDTLPVGLTFVSTTQGAICPTPPTPAPGQPVVVTCNVGSIANGSNVDISIQATIAPGVSGLLTDTAVIMAPNNQDLNLGDNTATVVTNTNVADLAVGMTPSANQVAPGSNLTYTITVTNNGPSASTGYTLTDTLPANASFVSATAGCVLSTVLTCTSPGLANGQSANYVVVVAPTAQGTVSNTASVSGTEPDLVPANNSATVTVTAIAVDLAVSMTAAPPIVAPGANLTYTITVTNNGPSASTGYTLTDTLPANATFVSATSGCVLTTVLTCSGPSLGVGLTSTYVVVVSPTTLAALTNTASVTGNEPDPVPGNNSLTLQDLSATADLGVSAAGAPSPVGGFPAYAATVTNNGPSDATNVVLTDLLDNFGFVSASSTQGACTFSAPTVTCTLGTLPNGASAVVTVVEIAPDAGWAANLFAANGAQPDPNPINNAFRLGPSLASFNTPVGTNIAVNTADPVDNLAASLTFSNVTRAGSTTMSSMSATSLPAGFRSGRQPAFFDISTNAQLAGSIAVKIQFVPGNYRHPTLVRLFHFEGGAWVDRTVGRNVASSTIVAKVMSLSPFALLEPVDAIPVANPGADHSVPGTTAAGARVALDGSASVDADGDPLTYRWSGPFPEGSGTVTGVNPTVTLPLGASKVSLVVNDGEADSSAVALNLTVADFQVSAPVGSVTLARGQSTSFTITMTPQYGAFGAPISLSCAPGASDVTCSFSSASVTPGAAATTATLTVTAAATVARAPGRSMPAYLALWLGTLPVFGGVFLAAGRRKKWQMAVLLMLALVLVASHIGCGGGGMTRTQSSSTQSTPASKAVTITVTGTSGTLQHSSSVTVTIPQ